MSKLVIVDGNAIMHRAFHAMPPLSTPKGEPINAVHGLVSMLLKIIQDVKPTHLAICFDEKEKTFRQKELPTYQAQRPPMVMELVSQFVKAREFLKTAKIPVYSMGGYEADDVIGTIASTAVGLQTTDHSNKKAVDRSLSTIDGVVIATGDRDILQLVDDKLGIKLYMPIAGLINAKLYGDKETVERMGVVPKLIPDYKGLVGDASDNYFGVPGIGPKTAITLLSEYGDFENIYKHLDKITGKTKEKLEKGKESGFLSFKLATIVTNVPVKIDFNEMEKWNLGSPEVIKLFTEKFGFKTLTQRIIAVSKKIEDEKQMSLL
ncbi:MAG TPA: 5'-3' exonuclease H3TH domain-containing protein [Patescibacteria group bacterium]|nr:5'-3' exonuclease H3TH domain-containing protein [Patescibacteria group bacterium]